MEELKATVRARLLDIDTVTKMDCAGVTVSGKQTTI